MLKNKRWSSVTNRHRTDHRDPDVRSLRMPVHLGGHVRLDRAPTDCRVPQLGTADARPRHATNSDN